MKLMLEALDGSRQKRAQPESADPFSAPPTCGFVPDTPSSPARRCPWILMGAGVTDWLAAGIVAGLFYGSWSPYPSAMPINSPVISLAGEPQASTAEATPLAISDVPASSPPPERSTEPRPAVTTNFIHHFIASSREVAGYPPAVATPDVAKGTPSSPPHQAQATLRLEKVTAQDSVTAAWQALAEGQLDKAESLYRRALQAQPRNQEGTLGLASVLHRKGNREGAWKAYREVLAQSPDNAIAVTGMMILLSESDPVSAESRIKQFIDARPGEEGPQLALGHLMARQKRWSEAQAAFFAAYTLQPGSASNNYNLAVALDRLHQHGQALKFYRAALEGTDVQNIPADSARQRIKTLSAQGVDKP